MSGTDFFARTKFRYLAQVQRADGEMVEHEIVNCWDPKKDYTIKAIAETAAGEYSAKVGPRGPKGEMMPCAGVSAVHVP